MDGFLWVALSTILKHRYIHMSKRDDSSRQVPEKSQEDDAKGWIQLLLHRADSLEG